MKFTLTISFDNKTADDDLHNLLTGGLLHDLSGDIAEALNEFVLDQIGDEDNIVVLQVVPHGYGDLELGEKSIVWHNN